MNLIYFVYVLAMCHALDPDKYYQRRKHRRRLEEPSYLVNQCTHEYSFKDDLATVSLCKTLPDSSTCNA